MLCLASPFSSQAKPNWVIKPPPRWVELNSLSVVANTNLEIDAHSGSLYLLADQQFRVSDRGTERYYRHIRKVLSSAGLENVSQIELDFEPSYQALVIHHLRIIRGGTSIDVLRPREIKIIQQENELNERLYNGTLSAVAFLNDVRIGDIIDYAYSVNGDNPVLAGRFADTFSMSYSQPVQELRRRLLWPANRKIQIRSRNLDLQPSVQQLQGEIDYRWQRDNLPAFEIEDAVPNWFYPEPVVQLSEFSTWEDVVRWAVPLYKAKQPLGVELSRQIDRWRSELMSPEQRLLAATRFVQDDVRYLGIELGSYSHMPKDPSSVFQSRFGDCKDKSLLLTTILNGLGIEAHPALVNTDALQSLDQLQPSPSAFDHVIVQVKLGGRAYWFDPTVSFQRGDLSEHANPLYRRALVVGDGSAALEEIPESPNEPVLTSVQERYVVSAYQEPVIYEIVSTYRGSDANWMRNWLAHKPMAELSRDYLNYYAETYPNIEADGPAEAQDEPVSNTVVIRERYRIPEFWRDKSRTVDGDRIYQELRKPETVLRTMPLRVSYPVNLVQSIEIEMPEPVASKTSSGTLQDSAVRFEYSSKHDGRVIRLHYSFRTLQDQVPVAEVARHLALLDRISNSLSYEVPRDSIAASSSDLPDAVYGVIGLLGLAGVAVMAIAVTSAVSQEFKRRRGLRRQSRPAIGGPDRAITFTAEAEIGRHLGALKCSCGGTFYHEGEPIPQHEGGNLNGQRLVVIEVECKSCRKQNDAYFVQLKPDG